MPEYAFVKTERAPAISLMETRNSFRRVPQVVVSLLELINQAIHIHRALHKHSVKVTCDALKFDQIGLRWRLDSSHYFVSTETRERLRRNNHS